MSNAKRWRFVSDNDGHNYLIPEETLTSFGRWLLTVEEDFDWHGTHFEDFRINGPSFYTFVDPVEDQ